MDAVALLEQVVAALPGGGEARAGQKDMAAAVERAIARRRHLVVQAGTGTGKSLAYLVPAVQSGQTVVVATATKALQDQLITKDLPFLAEHADRPITFASLKGRANYLCLQRARETVAALDGTNQQLALDGDAERAPRDELVRIIEWATRTDTGDRADLPFEPQPRTWAALSTSARDCPGAAKCPVGDACFAERARAAAAEADVVVVNTHLYGLHLATGGGILPEHDLVVIDEAHQLEEVISATAGVELTGGSVTARARVARNLIADDRIPADLDASAGQLADALIDLHGQRLRHPDPVLGAAIDVARGRVQAVLAATRTIESSDPDVVARKQRVVKAATSLLEELDRATEVPDGDVMWVEGPPHAPRLRIAPIDVAGALAALWDDTTTVLTSATIPKTLPARLGMPFDEHDVLDVGSPFDYESHALLYCAAHLPDPRGETYEHAVHDELEALITAAGGRTLALFTSWKAMERAVAALKPKLPFVLLDQTSLPKPALVKAFTGNETSCLFATMGFWQGIDVPGRALSLVVIDKLPFPRPDEPLLQARRERARAAAFATVDLPRAATLLAQGAGRLIRTASDRGVVAVLDPRLAKATYRWDIVNALPPMRRTKDRAEAERFLRAITDDDATRSESPGD